MHDRVETGTVPLQCQNLRAVRRAAMEVEVTSHGHVGYQCWIPTGGGLLLLLDSVLGWELTCAMAAACFLAWGCK